MSAPESNGHASVLCAGMLVADLFVPPLPHVPAAGQLLATEDFLLDSGGCAANTAVCLTKLGVEAAVVGKVGDDVFGTFVEQDLHRKGIKAAAIQRSVQYGTSKTVILTVAGEDRRFIHTFGANADFSVQDIDRTMLSQARVFYLGGYLALPNLVQGELAELLRFAHQHGVMTMLDVVVSADAVGLYSDALADLLPHVDIFTPNDEEAQILTGETEPQRQAQRFLDAGCGNVVITMGEQGSLLMNARQRVEAPAFPVEVVDGSGAGDAFAAGLIYGLLQGWDWSETLQFASAIGASACMQLGCTTSAFTRTQAEAFLRSHSLALRLVDRMVE